jgi:plasmid stabilization system protein ParE
MTPRLVLEPEAEDDLENARAWYEQRVAGLGGEFVAAVRETLETIERAPMQFRVERADVRKAVLRHFPYIIRFVVLDDVISVIAVFHVRRDPAIWHRRADV